jgi:Glycosyl transferases group 1
MKRVVFYVEPDWAFGAVHNELMKWFRIYGYDCRILPWNKSYTLEAMRELDNVTDLWLTTPHGWRFLGYDYCCTVPEKCAVIGHAKIDMAEVIHYHGYGDFDKFYSYACVSPWLSQVSKDLGIQREAKVTPVAINYNMFYGEPSEKLTTLGYAGKFEERNAFTPEQIFSDLAQPKYHKRGYLVREIAERLGLNFKVAEHYHRSFVTMSGYYRSVDCLLIPSTEEGAGLPAMEAGAAGKLVIGTPVGHWKTRITDAGGIEVPIPEDEFVGKTIEYLNYYIAHPKEYRDKCYQIREHARTYDWAKVIDSWVNQVK